jgi:hypothetical protein
MLFTIDHLRRVLGKLEYEVIRIWMMPVTRIVREVDQTLQNATATHSFGRMILRAGAQQI